MERQIVPAGTPLDDLTLPATLGASGYIVAGGADPEPEAITITGVAWEPDSPWDDTAGQGGYTSPRSFRPVIRWPAAWSRRKSMCGSAGQSRLPFKAAF